MMIDNNQNDGSELIPDIDNWVVHLNNKIDIRTQSIVFLDFDGTLYDSGRVFPFEHKFGHSGQSVEDYYDPFVVKDIERKIAIVQSYPTFVIDKKFEKVLLEKGVVVGGVISRRQGTGSIGLDNMLSIMKNFGMIDLPIVSMFDKPIPKLNVINQIALTAGIKNKELILIDDMQKEQDLCDGIELVNGNSFRFVLNTDLGNSLQTLLEEQ